MSLRAGETRMAAQAEGVKGRGVPPDVVVVVSVDGEWCKVQRRPGGPVNRARVANIEKRFPVVVQEDGTT